MVFQAQARCRRICLEVVVRQLNQAHWPHKVIIYSDWKRETDVLELWLLDNIGKYGKHWTLAYRFGATDFYFQNTTDAAFFALKWHERTIPTTP